MWDWRSFSGQKQVTFIPTCASFKDILHKACISVFSDIWLDDRGHDSHDLFAQVQHSCWCNSATEPTSAGLLTLSLLTLSNLPPLRKSQFFIRKLNGDSTEMGQWVCVQKARVLRKHWLAKHWNYARPSSICIQTQLQRGGCFYNTTFLSINIWVQHTPPYCFSIFPQHLLLCRV